MNINACENENSVREVQLFISQLCFECKKIPTVTLDSESLKKNDSEKVQTYGVKWTLKSLS